MKKLSAISICLVSTFVLQSQTRFLENVKVEYERVVYIRQMLKELWGADNFEKYGAGLPQSSNCYFDFSGSLEKSVYKAGKEQTSPAGWWDNLTSAKNVVITDYTNKTVVSHKPVFEDNFLVQDTMLNIKWKLTADTRMIAGFECRKAIGILHDSIAIFAFYTDEVLVTGGPERIQGLPGLILGAGVPRLHTTWFATKVEINNAPVSAPAAPRKAKTVTNEILMQELERALQIFGENGKKLLLNFML